MTPGNIYMRSGMSFDITQRARPVLAQGCGITAIEPGCYYFMPQTLGQLVQSCLARSAEAERLAALEPNESAKTELRDLALTWRQIAASYEYVAKLESFLKTHPPADQPMRKH